MSDKKVYTAPTMTLLNHGNLLLDIICNGFNLKQIIVDCLITYNTEHNIGLLNIQINEIAEYIKEVMAIKMRLKQDKE